MHLGLMFPPSTVASVQRRGVSGRAYHYPLCWRETEKTRKEKGAAGSGFRRAPRRGRLSRESRPRAPDRPLSRTQRGDPEPPAHAKFKLHSH